MAKLTIHHTDHPDVADHLQALCTQNNGVIASTEAGVTVAVFETLDQLETVAVPLGAAYGRTITRMDVEG